MSDQEYQEMLDNTPVSAEAIIKVHENLPKLVANMTDDTQPTVKIKGTKAEDKLLEWAGQQER
jgi:hypothetical protein|tara:strand:- start:388 stop:576 length:189 start_codon:yes stop_codon:yes gene_type:complete